MQIKNVFPVARAVQNSMYDGHDPETATDGSAVRRLLIGARNVLLIFIFSFPFQAFSVSSAKESTLLSQQEIDRFGLKRIWFNQVEIDPVRSKILHAVVEGGMMFVVTDDSRLHAIDAESGKSLWIRSLGDRDMMLQEPSANSRMVSVLNGLELFVFDRRNGKLLLNIPLPGAASTACEMSENYVYIPMMGDRMIAYPLEDTESRLVLESEGASNTSGQNMEQETTSSSMTDAEKEPDDGEDPVLANIVKQFEAAKQSVLAEKEPPQKEPDIVLRGALGIPMVCQTFGNVLVKPKLTSQLIVYTPRNQIRLHRETVAWVTDRGFLLAAGINALSQEHFELQYMVDSSSQTYFLGSDRIARREWTRDKEIVVRPTSNQCVPYLYTDNKPHGSEIPSLAVVGSRGAYVFAVRDRTGEVEWQFAAKGPILQRIAVVGTEVYCSADSEGMHALDLLSGTEKWFTPDIREFVAASEKRLYTLDHRTRFVVLNRATGNPVGSFDARRFDRFLFNIETDRIYAINNSGLIQCLAEKQLNKENGFAEDGAPPVIRHRLSCKQYTEVLRGKKGPDLYWLASRTEGGADDPEAGPAEGTEPSDDSPIGTTRTPKKSGEDGSLDGDDTEDASPRPAPQQRTPPKKEEEDNPF